MQNAWYKNKVVIGVIVVILVVLGITLFGGDKVSNVDNMADNNSGEKQEVSLDLKSGEIAVVGKFGCTPLKSGKTPTKEECVLGLVGDDGKFYSLNTSKVESIGNGVQSAEKIKVIGTYTATNASSEEATVFKYDGVMAVRVMSASK